jgi:hypothetical protein
MDKRGSLCTEIWGKARKKEREEKDKRREILKGREKSKCI